ncbi:MAG: serine/threonine protein kinase, partial [Anaerolineae bacterium]|nr:serine/threonine protein kinase [Anaerolineae bacterium]
MTDLIGQSLGQYEIISLVGVGSTAVVYQARPAGTASIVALKVIETRLARDPDVVRRFGREADAIAALSHPNILTLFGHGQQGDWLYLVMEMLPGGTLAQRIRERPLSGARVARYLDQIARALDYAHGESIIHRDLRPQNVLFDRQGN